jgi:hypothetical protein
LLLGLVANPTIEYSLVNAFGRTGANEAVPKRMPSFDDRPFAVFEDAPERLMRRLN